MSQNTEQFVQTVYYETLKEVLSIAKKNDLTLDDLKTVISNLTMQYEAVIEANKTKTTPLAFLSDQLALFVQYERLLMTAIDVVTYVK